jgi:hypothetical protein
MLKRRPSKRFVLSGTGEEGTWDTSKDGSELPNEQPTTSEVNKISEKPMDLLSVKQELKSGMK